MSAQRLSGARRSYPDEGFGERPKGSGGRSAAKAAHPAAAAASFSRDEMLRFLDFVEEIELEQERVLPLSTPDPFLHITQFLIRNHLEAKLTTISSLAVASQAPYATAMRRIKEMTDSGMIVQRPRSKSGKTFSLHPSPELIEAWYDYARRVKLAVGRAMGLGEKGLGADYYFGGSYLSAQIIGLPPVREEPLRIAPPLRILVHADPTFMAMDTLKRQFEQILGVAIQNRALSIDRLRLDMLDNAGREQSAYDIMAVDLPWIGEFAASEVLAPIDEVVARRGVNASDFEPAGWSGCFYRGRQYGIPIQTTPELLFYRTDILEEAGIEPPQTTEALLEAARVLHQPQRGQRGIAWNAAKGTPLGHTFIMIMADFGQPILNLRPLGDGNFDAADLTGEHLRPMIDTPAARDTAHYLLELLAYSPTNILSMSWYERIVAYGRGDVAMAYGYTLLTPYFELDEASPAHGRTGFLPHPRGTPGPHVAPVGGYVLGIPSNLAPERREAVETSLVLLTSAEACKLYITNGSRVCPRFSVSADPEVRALSPVIAAVDRMARVGQLQYWPRPPVPEMAGIYTIVGEEMHLMLRGLKSIDAALADAQNAADTLMRAHGYAY